MAFIESIKKKTKVASIVVFLFTLFVFLGSAVNTAPVDIFVFKGITSVDNASLWVDGQYRGVTAMGGHLYITNLTVGYHSVNAQYEDNSGKYVGSSGFENIPGVTNAKVYLQQIK
ncbi:MAG: hypothetical protein LUQ38_10590 [Methanotrichaceae archaeon]|nr:hypothetical protein [Methanotrichaceae archaeon]